MKILLTGSSGVLGKELIKLFKKTNHFLDCPSSTEMDVCNLELVRKRINKEKPDLIVHCAAYTNVKKAETDFIKCLDVNILGTLNILKCCHENNIKLVFISTEHVFDGEKGDYKTTDLINPVGKYAKSKAAAELACRTYEKSLIIRTSFYDKNFPYEYAFIDQWTTKDYIDIIAPKILNLILSEKFGIVNCGSVKRTIFEIAKSRKHDVKPFERKDLSFPTPKDTSLYLDEE